MERIEKGELEIEKMRLVQEAIETKLYNTLKDLSVHDPTLESFSVQEIPYPDLPVIPESKKASQSFVNPNPLFDFSVQEDLVLTSGIFKFGYGQWELIRNHYRQSELLRFNWIAKSRSTLDIQKRCDFLINHRFKRENALAA